MLVRLAQSCVPQSVEFGAKLGAKTPGGNPQVDGWGTCFRCLRYGTLWRHGPRTYLPVRSVAGLAFGGRCRWIHAIYALGGGSSVMSSNSVRRWNTASWETNGMPRRMAVAAIQASAV